MRLCADVLVWAPEDEGTGLGKLSLRYRFLHEDPEVSDSLWTVAEVGFNRGLVAHFGMNNLDTSLLLPEPEPGEGWTFEGADVVVSIQNTGYSIQARVYVDNVQLSPSGPWPDYGWWQACDTSGVLSWDLGAGNGQKQVWASFQDSTGVERLQPESDGIILDATPPDVNISEPEPGTYVNGLVPVTGWAFDSTVIQGRDFFLRYLLEYRHADSTEWRPNDPDSICYTPVDPDTATTGIHSSHLGYWNTAGLPDGQYYVRVIAQDSAGNEAEDQTWVEVNNTNPPGGGGEGPQGGGSGMGEGSIYVGSMTGRVIHLNEDLDSIGGFTVADSSGPAYVSALLKLGDDSLLVLDARNRAIHKLGRNGQNRRRLVSNLGLPTALAKDANGNIWLCDKGSGRVAKFRPNGTLVFAKTKGEGDTLNLSGPEGIANSQVGNRQWVYIADTRNNRVVVWDTGGRYIRNVGEGIKGPRDIVSGNGEGIYVVDSAGRIVGLNSRGGKFLTITAEDSSPLKCLLASEDGRHLFTLKPRGNKVLKYRTKSDDSLPGGQQASGRVQLPTRFVLYQPWPNPSRRASHIRYGIPKSALVSLKLYDITGRCCRTLVNAEQKPGYYDITWDATDNHGRTTANGVYFCQFQTSDYRATQKLIVQR
ncbi:T9SS type A sorting domain-containing protein [candidate division WOR-3 bacterium]|nr:T9SS type A sorting domain-containing protein [candidate division WOR-3 bacterium]